ncbi:MAG: hypothetical protein ACKOBT_08770 [Actinomycetota bacterium]
MAKGPDLYEQAQAWLQSDRGLQYAAKLLRIRGLVMDPQEIRDETLLKMWDFVQRRPDKDIENVRGYCATVMGNVITQVLRGQRDLPFDTLDDGDSNPRPEARRKKLQPVVPVTPSPDTAPEREQVLIGQLRACVEAVGRSPQPASAVLTYLTLQAFTETDIAVTGLPQPKSGARKDDHARWWPSLHLAHQDPDLFPWMDRQYPAQRQRLRRARQAAERVLDQAKFLHQNGIAS